MRETQIESHHGGLGPVGGSKLLQDGLHMDLDRALEQAESTRDLLVRKPEGELRQHLALARRQPVEGARAAAAGMPRLLSALGPARQHAAGQIDLAGEDEAERMAQN